MDNNETREQSVVDWAVTLVRDAIRMEFPDYEFLKPQAADQYVVRFRHGGWNFRARVLGHDPFRPVVKESYSGMLHNSTAAKNVEDRLHAHIQNVMLANWQAEIDAKPPAPSPQEPPQQSAPTVDAAGCSGDGPVPQEWISGSIRHGVLNAASHKPDPAMPLPAHEEFLLLLLLLHPELGAEAVVAEAQELATHAGARAVLAAAGAGETAPAVLLEALGDEALQGRLRARAFQGVEIGGDDPRAAFEDCLGRLRAQRNAEWLFDSLKPGAFNAALRQPPPVGDGQVILDLVVADLRARADAGELKYGTKLRAFNGRDALLDAYQEALDLVMYLRQAMVEAAAPEAVCATDSGGPDGDHEVTVKMVRCKCGRIICVDSLETDSDKKTI